MNAKQRREWSNNPAYRCHKNRWCVLGHHHIAHVWPVISGAALFSLRNTPCSSSLTRSVEVGEAAQRQIKIEVGDIVALGKPKDMFKNATYSAWDDAGVPTKTAAGDDVTKNRKKKCAKQQKKQARKLKKITEAKAKWGFAGANAAFVAFLRTNCQRRGQWHSPPNERVQKPPKSAMKKCLTA